MSSLKRFCMRLLKFSTNRRGDDRLREEMESYLAAQTEENIRAGMRPDEARRQARLKLGAMEAIWEEYHAEEGLPLLEHLIQDVRYALRQLRKSPAFTTAALLTLALGIGATTAVFSAIDTVLFHPLPYRDPSQLMFVTESLPKLGGGEVGVSAQEYLDYAQLNHVFSQVAVYMTDACNLTGAGQPLHVNEAQISTTALPLLGVMPILGRNFTAQEGRYGSDHVVLLSHELWQTHYGADPHILGKTIHLNRTPYTVVGVMPASFRFPADSEPISERPSLWLPLAFAPDIVDPHHRVRSFGYKFIGRLKTGVTAQQAQQDMTRVADDFMRQYSDTYVGNIRVVPHAYPFAAHSVAKTRPLLILLAAAVFCVLLIACANVANLLLARSTARSQEMALRAAIGASRIRIVRQCLVESGLLGILGSIGGVLLAALFLIGLKRFGPASLPRLQDVSLHPVALVFAVALALLTSVFFGFAPAWQLSRVAPESPLRAARQVGADHGSQGLQSVIAAAQVALAVALLIAGGLLLRSFARLLDSSYGFNPHNAFIVRTVFDEGRYPDVTKHLAVEQQILSRLSHLPGVTATAEATHLPLSNSREIGIHIEHAPANDYHWAGNSFVTPSYFRTMGIPLLQGRDFGPTDTPSAPPVAIVSQSFAREYFPGQSAIGRHFDWGKGSNTIIGVVADVHISSLTDDPPPMVYLDTTYPDNHPNETAFILRSKLDPAVLLPAIRQQIYSVDKDLPVYDATTLEQLVSDSVAQRRFTIVLLGGFGVIALVLAAIGIFGVISYLVAQRTREFGVRMALGADRLNIARLVLRRGANIALAGCLCGLALSVLASHLLRASLYHTGPFDPATLCLVPFLLLIVVLIAAWLPALRAASIDPMQALRSE